MHTTSVGDLEICYERSGSADAPQILLISGLGVQLVWWPDYFVEQLVSAGFGVIRFDNRDAGLSSRVQVPPPDIDEVIGAVLTGETPQVPYLLADMAGDAVGLLDHLGVASAHVLGVSMGAMIAQQTAISFPSRVESLISVMGTPHPSIGQPTAQAQQAIMSAPADDSRAAAIDHGVAVARVWTSPGHLDEDELIAKLEQSYDRTGGSDAAATARQFAALLASPSREQGLSELDMPTLVIHGDADPLVTPEAGARTAELIAGAKLMVVAGMAHDLPGAFTPGIVEAVAAMAGLGTA